MEPQYGPFELIRKRARTPDEEEEGEAESEEEENQPLARVRERLLARKEGKYKRRVVVSPLERPESKPQQPEGSGVREEARQDIQALLQEKGIVLTDREYVAEAESLRKAYEQLRLSWQELETKYPKQYSGLLNSFTTQPNILTNLAANLGQYQYLFGDYVSLIMAAFPVVSRRKEIDPERVKKQIHLTKENLLANAIFVTHYLHDLWMQPVEFEQKDVSVENAYNALTKIQKHILNNFVDKLNQNLAPDEMRKLATQLRQDNPYIVAENLDTPHLLAIYPPNADPTQDATLATLDWLKQEVQYVLQSREAAQPWNENPAQANIGIAQ
jgi:hypothetical protein